MLRFLRHIKNHDKDIRGIHWVFINNVHVLRNRSLSFKSVCVCMCVCVSYKTSSFCKDLITFANVLANWSVGNEDAVDPKPVAVPAVGLQAGR